MVPTLTKLRAHLARSGGQLLVALSAFLAGVFGGCQDGQKQRHPGSLRPENGANDIIRSQRRPLVVTKHACRADGDAVDALVRDIRPTPTRDMVVAA